MPLGTSLLLKDKQSLFASHDATGTWKRYALEFFVVSILGLLVFGGLAADSSRWHEIWQHGFKFVTLYWGSILICVPSLYVFSAVRGSKITIAELGYFTVAALATIGIVLVSIAPITGFFAWTTESKTTMQFINVLAAGVALLFGLYLIGRGYAHVYELRKSNDPKSKSGLDFFLLWFFLLLAVMVQMGVTLNIIN